MDKKTRCFCFFSLTLSMSATMYLVVFSTFLFSPFSYPFIIIRFRSVEVVPWLFEPSSFEVFIISTLLFLIK